MSKNIVFTGLLYDSNKGTTIRRIQVVKITEKHFDVEDANESNDYASVVLASGFTLRGALDAFFESENLLIEPR